MTHSTFRKLCYHAGWMRCAMAALTCGDILVSFLVAGRAGERRMLGSGAGEHVCNRLVAGRTVLVRHIRTIGNHEGHVGRMAHRAVFVHHIRRMRLMALQAFRDVSVRLVACRAEELGMSARVLFHLFPLLVMTGQARGGKVCGKFHFEGRVRVGMAGVATADLVMRFPCVA